MFVTPNINFSGNFKNAIMLYEKAFNTKSDFILLYEDAKKEDWNNPITEEQKNWVYHAEMHIGSQRFMFADIIDFDILNGNSFFVTLTFDSKLEVINAFNVLSNDGEILVPPHSTTYSSCCTTIVDKFGIRWGLMTEHTDR